MCSGGPKNRNRNCAGPIARRPRPFFRPSFSSGSHKGALACFCDGQEQFLPLAAPQEIILTPSLVTQFIVLFMDTPCVSDVEENSSGLQSRDR